MLVVGDVTADELRPLAEHAYGGIPPAPPPARWRPASRRNMPSVASASADPRVRQPSLMRSYLAPSLPRRAGARLRADGAGRDPGGRRHQPALSQDGHRAGAGDRRRLPLSRGLLDQTCFRIYLSPRPGIDLDAVEAGLDAELERLLRDGVEPDECHARSGACWPRRSMLGISLE